MAAYGLPGAVAAVRPVTAMRTVAAMRTMRTVAAMGSVGAVLGRHGRVGWIADGTITVAVVARAIDRDGLPAG